MSKVMTKHGKATTQVGAMNTSRRAFLQVVGLGTVGFAVGCSAQNTADDSGVPLDTAAPAETSELNAFVKVASDNSITVVVKHIEMGQGSSTGLTTLVAEEMDASWDQMRWEPAPANNDVYMNFAFGIQNTGGSTAIANSYMQMRQMGAAARAMLVDAAAAEWGVAASEISVSGGTMSHPSGKSGTYGEFAEAASAMTPPAEPALKSPEDFNLIGQNVPRLDKAGKVAGAPVFTIDYTPEDAIHVAMIRAPKHGATVASFDAAEALEMPGVSNCVQTPVGIAVAADSFYNALNASRSVVVDWDDSAAANQSSSELLANLKTLAETPGIPVRDEGDVENALGEAHQVITASYDFPFLAHASMEPMNATVQIANGFVDIWTASQSPYGDQLAAAQVVGVPPENVRVHGFVAGGSFGRRATLTSDYVVDTLFAALALGTDKPVKLQWTRENDMGAGKYRPMAHIQLKGGLDEDGNVVAWHQRNSVPSYAAGTPFENLFFIDGVDHSISEGILEMQHDIPNFYFDVHQPTINVPTSWWRSVGHSFNAYAKEAFINELAQAGGRDPIELRRQLLANSPRELGVLNRAVEEAGPAPVGEGRARGVAVHESFKTFVAEVADVTLNPDGSYTIDRIVCAVDCGVAVNPDVITAQMEGSIAMGLGAIMQEAITLTDGELDQTNFHAYAPMRMSRMPKSIEVHIVASAEAPTGVGEPGLPPVGPAIASALQQAGAAPLRSMPIGEFVETLT